MVLLLKHACAIGQKPRQADAKLELAMSPQQSEYDLPRTDDVSINDIPDEGNLVEGGQLAGLSSAAANVLP